MKVFVSGSGGFIGKELVKNLKKRRVKVIEFDRKNGFDILNFNQLKENMKACDAVIHLAALLDESLPLEELRKINVLGTKKVLEAAVQNNVKKFLLLSTTGVYGDFKGQAHENYPINPSTNYEISKAESEEVSLKYQKKITLIIIRSALVLGPNEYWKQIIELIKKGFPIIGNGNNKWQICYYKDLVNAIIFLLYNPKAKGIFNVAENPEKAKNLKELVELVKKELGIREKTKHVPTIIGYLILWFNKIANTIIGKKTIISTEYIKRILKNRNYSIEKLKKIGWKPKYSTEKAIKETIKDLF